MYHFVCQVQGKVGSKDGKSFKTEQQWCDTCCCRYALCPYVCKYIEINRMPKYEFKMLLFMCSLCPLIVSLQPMHDDYDLRQEQLNKASLLSSKKFLENLLEKFITNVVDIFLMCVCVCRSLLASKYALKM